jgi:TetR/AcrR family transcriptional regulator, regulator of biofilm formation and stress response
MAGSRRVPNDPERKARILDAALAVIAERGVHATTHRRIAAEAAVPLGSLTYYFDGIDQIFEQAFAQLAEGMSARYEAALKAARDQAEACDAVTELICGGDYVSQRELVLMWELYAYANHNEAVATTTRDWLRRSRASLARHFSPTACVAIDALVEAWPMHQSFQQSPLDRDAVRRTIAAIASELG